MVQLWRLARVCSCLVDMTSDKDQQKALAFEGQSYAEQAFASDGTSAVTNKWLGILTGLATTYRPLKDKIACAFVVRDCMQRALAQEPQDPICHSVLGQWCLACADLTWVEKRMAATLFSNPPTSTHAEALTHFLAVELVTQDKKNAVLLAQTYAKLQQPTDARKWLEIARQRPPSNAKEDEQLERDVRSLERSLPRS